MRKILVHWGLALSLLGASSPIFAQISIYAKFPSGYHQPEALKQLTEHTITPPAVSRIDSMVSGSHPKAGDMYLIGTNVPVSMSSETHGTWTSQDGYVTWRLHLSSPGAQALGVLYHSFRIPTSAAFFVYHPDRNHKSRAYTAADNPGGDAFSTEVIVGESIILEYWAPAWEATRPDIQLEGLTYIFREGHTFRPRNASDNGSSANCHVNVNCSEGNNWQDAKRGVAKIIVIDGNAAGLCTGSLVNNTAQDCKNYFLTAQHCGSGASTTNFQQWQFYFNFESSNCSNLTNSQANNVDNQVVTGCTKRATSADASGISTSDFLLVEFNSAIPSNFNPFYNGWDRVNTPASSGVGIHHPSGDIKKISTYTTTLGNDSWNPSPSGTHWRVTWAGTTNGHGVTEPGSSGSPLFNASRRIIGDLSGGGSFCNSVQPGGQTIPDLYGKFSYSWESAGSSNARRLRPWLDPAGTNPNTLDGRNACTGTPPPVGGCDTVSRFLLGVHTASALTAPGGTGWLAGNNSYNDLAKAEAFLQTDFPAGYQLTGFMLYFHAATGTGNITVKVWQANGAGGAPGTVLAQGSVPISSIPTNGSPLVLNLNTPIPISSNFYIGLDLPTGTGNTVGLYTTAANEPSINSGWEQYSDGNWFSYESSYSAKFAHAIFAIGCPQSTSGQAPVANFTGTPLTLPAGNNVTFTNTSTNNPTSYSWSFSPNTGITYQNGTTSTSANPVVRFANPGQYSVTLTATNASGSDSETKTNYITVTSTMGVENEQANGLQVYPNPASKALYLDLGFTTSVAGHLQVFDLAGRVLMTQSWVQGSASATLPLESLPNGVYVVQLTLEGGQRFMQRFVKTAP